MGNEGSVAARPAPDQIESSRGVQATDSDVTVIIPALNEEEYLPALLETLGRQTTTPREVLVVDASSTDGTVAAAEAGGATVIPGGRRPGYSRNLGARHARGSWLLFLDADVRLEVDALEIVLSSVEAKGLDAASTWFRPDGGGWIVVLHHWCSAAYFWATSKVGWPHSIGGFLLIRRSLHAELGGFDEEIPVAEDQDYVVRASRMGRYGFLRRPVVVIAARRFEERGFIRQSLQWLAIEAHRLLLGEIRTGRFRYFE